MTDRKCHKCGDSLVPNERLGIMECVSGRHIEPINTVRAQWWNQCSKCGQMGLNEANQEARLQKFKNGKPVSVKVGDKKKMTLFEEQTAEPITCKACGHIFTKI